MTTIDRRVFLESAAGLAALASLRPREAGAAGGMKKALYVSMLPKELGYRERFQMALDVGFEGIEIGTIADPKVAEEIRDAAAKTGLKIHSVMNADHWKYPLSSADPDVVAKSVAGRLLPSPDGTQGPSVDTREARGTRIRPSALHDGRHAGRATASVAMTGE